MSAAEILRSAADKLRDPNHPSGQNPDGWDREVALHLAYTMEQVARALRLGDDFLARVGYSELVAVARAVLREDAP